MNLKIYTLCLLLFLSLLAAPAPLAAAPDAQQAAIHVVQWGETLSGIAWRYGATTQAIMDANGLAYDTIYAGQQLVIPTGVGAPRPETAETASTYHAVQWGENLSGIAESYGVTVTAVIQANRLPNANFIYAGQRLLIPERASAAPTTADVPDTYVVQPGDTLSGIAARFGLSEATLARLNQIVNPAFIYAGQTLRLKGSATMPAPVPAGGGKRIVVNLTAQRLYVYAGETLVNTFVISSGMPPYYTQTGEFSVLNKLPNPYSTMWGVWMPYWLGIYWVGGMQNGIHALPITANGERLWEGYLGQPASFGCIILGAREAEWLYAWVEVGTPVSIRY